MCYLCCENGVQHNVCVHLAGNSVGATGQVRYLPDTRHLAIHHYHSEDK